MSLIEDESGGDTIPDKNEVVILKTRLSSALDLGTLNVGVAVQFEADHGTGLLNAYLMKKVDCEVWIDAMDASDTILVGMARGGASVTEIKTALELTDLDRSRQGQANVRVVLHETLRLIWRDAAGGDVRQSIRIKESLGGGKGIPFDEGEGWQWFAYNAGANNQVAGALINVIGTHYGAWLGS